MERNGHGLKDRSQFHVSQLFGKLATEVAPENDSFFYRVNSTFGSYSSGVDLIVDSSNSESAGVEIGSLLGDSLLRGIGDDGIHHSLEGNQNSLIGVVAIQFCLILLCDLRSRLFAKDQGLNHPGNTFGDFSFVNGNINTILSKVNLFSIQIFGDFFLELGISFFSFFQKLLYS